MRLRVFILFLLIIEIQVFGQLNIKHYGESEGLYATGIKKIAFDEHNNLYMISNRQRLLYFNGREFTEYPTETRIDINLYLINDNLGELYLAIEYYSEARIRIYKINNALFPKLGEMLLIAPLYDPITDIQLFVEAGKNHLLINTEPQLVHYSFNKNQVKIDTSAKFVEKVICAKNGVYLLKNNNLLPYQLTQFKLGQNILESNTEFLHYDINSNYYLSLQNEKLIIRSFDKKELLFNIKLTTEQIKKFKNSKSHFFLNSNYLFIYSENTVTSLKLSNLEWINYLKETEFLPTTVYNIVQDRERNIWFSHELGISKIPNVRVYQKNPLGKNVEQEIASVCWFNKNQNLLFLGSNSEFCIYNYITNTVMHRYSMTKKIFNPSYNLGTYRILDAINSNNKVYFCAKGIGIYCIQGSYNQYKLTKTSITVNNPELITCVTKIKENLLVFGAENELIFYNTSLDKVVNYIKLKNYPYSIRKLFVYDSNNLILLNLTGGILYNHKNGKTTVINTTEACYSYLNEKHFGQHYIGSIHGLFRIENMGLVPEIDLQNTNIYGIVAEKNRMWLGTNSGIIIQRIKDKRIMQIGPHNGLYGVDINRSAFFYDEEKKLLFAGTNKGLNIIESDFEFPETVIPLYLKSILVGKEILFDIPKKLKKGNTLIFNFGYNSYIINPNFHYFYRIQELSNDWIELNTASLYLPNMDAGNYTIEVIVKSAGIDISNKLIYQVKIEPLWYESVLFYIISVLVAFGIISWIFINRINKLRNEKDKENQISKLKQQVVESKLSALRSQLNPHYVNNLLNRIRFYLSGNNNEIGTNMLTNYSNLMRYTFDNATNDFNSLAKELHFYKEFLFFEKDHENIQLKISLENILDPELEKLQIPTMIIQPIIENSIKHGFLFSKTTNEITINIEKTDVLKIIVTDNGKGFDFENLAIRKNSGIKITQSRLSYYNELGYGFFNMELSYANNTEKKGTKATFTLPIIEAR